MPRFRQSDYDGGLTAGVAALLAAAKGEYRGNGRTTADRRAQSGADFGLFRIGFILVFFVLWSIFRAAATTSTASRSGRSGTWGGGGPWIFPGGGGGGGGGSGGGGGGGFSGGGGGFGGGGAGGSW